jgi:Protein of unknown function (DUF2855)
VTECADFRVRRDDLRATRLVIDDAERLAPGPGQALLRVDHFAFTANNITYAVAGDLLDYWRFFPAEEGWGRIPVWGFADVVASQCPGLDLGRRFYGYYPMSTHLLVEPVKVGATGFSDGSEHRRTMAAPYNSYRDTAADPAYRADGEPAQMVLQPLFTTAFLIDDFLAESDFFGAHTVVLSSASSKTAFGLAFQLARRGGVEVVGLTSPGNLAFVESLGCYDRALPYDEVATLDASRPAVFVDMAGNGAVQSAVHHHFGSSLMHSATVGMTHWEQGKRESDLPGVAPAFFFAPARVQKRVADWGAAGFQDRTAAAFASFRGSSDRALRVVRGGRADVEQVYRDTLEGRAEPEVAQVLSLQEP